MRLALLLFLLSGSAFAKDVYVDGHYRKDGTYVQPHVRTAPDRNPYNNYSTQGNYNPYTGKVGTEQPTYQPYQPYQPDPYNQRGRSSIGR